MTFQSPAGNRVENDNPAALIRFTFNSSSKGIPYGSAVSLDALRHGCKPFVKTSPFAGVAVRSINSDPRRPMVKPGQDFEVVFGGYVWVETCDNVREGDLASIELSNGSFGFGSARSRRKDRAQTLCKWMQSTTAGGLSLLSVRISHAP